MKILAAGDIHGDKGLARNLSKKADEEDVDVVVLCGDLTNEDEDVEGIVGAFKKPVCRMAQPQRHNKPHTLQTTRAK